MVCNQEIVIYTCLVGNYDNLVSPLVANEEYKHICFSDKQRLIPGWEVVTFEQAQGNNTRNSRYPKIMSHLFLNCDYSIYHDANRRLNCNPKHLIDKYLLNCDIAMYKHPHRESVYSEGNAVIKMGKADKESVNTQLERYKAEDIQDNVLFAGGIILRRLSGNVIQFELEWWNDYCRGSQRDQLSLVYALQKTGIQIETIEGNYFNNKDFSKWNHNTT